jgi:hypothetical protein
MNRIFRNARRRAVDALDASSSLPADRYRTPRVVHIVLTAFPVHHPQALKKARTFEERKIQRRATQAAAATMTPTSANKVDAAKLSTQLAAARALDVDALGAHVGEKTLRAVLRGEDAPSAAEALPATNDSETKASSKAVGAAAVKAAGTTAALVVARRVLAAACVREEINALQEKLALVGDRQEWAKGRLAREEARRRAKEDEKAKKEAAREEAQREREEAKRRTTSRGPGDVDAQVDDVDDDVDDDEDEEEEEEEDDDDGESESEEEEEDERASESESESGDASASDGERGDLEEDDWSSGGEENARPELSDSDSESDSDDIVIRDDDGELRKFLAAEGEEEEEEEEEEDDDARFERESDSDVDPDDELPPELARILGVDKKPAKPSSARAAGKPEKPSDAKGKNARGGAAKKAPPAKKVRLLPIRPRSRGARRSLRTFLVVTLHPRFPFNV